MPLGIIVGGVIVIIGALALVMMSGDEERPEVANEEPQARVEETTDRNDDTASGDDGDGSTPDPDPVVEDSTPEPVPDPVIETAYVDGTYDAEVEYKVPGNKLEPMRVSITIANDIVTAASVDFDGLIGTSRLNQKKFSAAYQDEVIGVELDDIDLSRVGGASLTSGGFNEAVAKVQAAAAR